MNPSHSLQVPQLASPFQHAGGWGKLGWQSLELDQEDEDFEPGQSS